MTQAELAAAIGMTGTSIGLMERGDAPIEQRTELAAHKAFNDRLTGPYAFSVEPATAVGGWSVVFRHYRWRNGSGHHQSILYGYFKRQRDAERWAKALEDAENPRMQRRLTEAVDAAVAAAAK